MVEFVYVNQMMGKKKQNQYLLGNAFNAYNWRVLKHFATWHSSKIFMNNLSFWHRKLFMKSYSSKIFIDIKIDIVQKVQNALILHILMIFLEQNVSIILLLTDLLKNVVSIKRPMSVKLRGYAACIASVSRSLKARYNFVKFLCYRTYFEDFRG